MDIYEALEITKDYQTLGSPSPEEEFMLIEAFTFLIDHYGDTFDGSVYMYNLGDHYLRRGEYNLALKYLERSAACDNDVAYIPLGTIYYYGLVGNVDYKKAFECFKRTEDFPLSKLMLAEMYKEGQYVKKDNKKYRQYIFDTFEQVWDSPVPNYKGEAFLKYVEIIMEEEKNDNRQEEIAVILTQAEVSQQEQMSTYAMEHDYEIMKEIKTLLFKLNPDLELLSIFDLYWALSKPACVGFTGPDWNDPDSENPEYYPVESHLISSHDNGSSLEILFDDVWYRDIDHFFREASFEGFSAADVSFLFDDFEYVDINQ